MFRVGGGEEGEAWPGKEIYEPFIIYRLKDVSPFCKATLEIPLLYFQCTGTLYTSDESRGGTPGGPRVSPYF